MLLGNWKNFDELEENLSYPELVQMVKSLRESERRTQRFMAALKGIDLDKDEKKAEDPVEAAKRRARARMMNMDPDELKFQENIKAAGFGYRKA